VLFSAQTGAAVQLWAVTTYGFNPDQPGVKQLVSLASGLHGTSTIRLRSLYIDGDGPHAPGELITVPSILASQLVGAGSAEPADDQ
jgi:hypothetical protein